MIQLKKTLLTLVALFAISTGAWAQTVVNIGTMCPPDETTMEYNGDTWQWVQCNPAITNGYVDVKLVNGALKNDNMTPTVTQLIHAFTICNLMIFGEQGKVSTVQLLNANGEKVKEVTVNKELKWDGNNISIAPADLLSGAMAENYIIRVYLSEYSLAMEKTKDKNEWTLDAMPAGNVELQVAYFPGMLTLAQAEGGSIAVDGLSLGGPKAFDVPAEWSSDETTFSANDLPADFAAIDDADLPATIAALSSDAVAVLIYGFDGEKTKLVPYVNGTKDDTDAGKCKRSDVSTWIEGGMKVYYTTAATLPAGFDTDGTNYYVEPKTQFQVKAVPAEGYKVLVVALGSHAYDVDADGIATVTMPEGDTDETLTGIFTNQFELTFDDVNFKTNQNITVKVGDADKTLDQDGKLSVKAGQTVTLTAKQGYKFRSVEAKKGAGGAEGHTIAESVVGDIIGSDGKAYAVADKDKLPEGVTAVAMMANSSTSTKRYAVAFADESGTLGWDDAKSTCSAKTAVPGGTWGLVSADAWNSIFSKNGGNMDSYTGLNENITAAGGTALQEGNYWTLTEYYADNTQAYTIELSAGSKSLQTKAKTEPCRVRAVLVFSQDNN